MYISAHHALQKQQQQYLKIEFLRWATAAAALLQPSVVSMLLHLQPVALSQSRGHQQSRWVGEVYILTG
jgi:hypothetical protein